MAEQSIRQILREARENAAAPQQLNHEQQLSLLKLTTARCRQATRQAIADNIKRPFNEWPGRWAIERVYFDGNLASYCAGQDYTTEMVELRKQLIQFR